MAKEEVTEIIETERTTAYYLCDKCYGHNHEKTEFKEDLNVVAFGARAYANTFLVNDVPDGGAYNTTFNTDREAELSAEYEHLLCDDCMERAHDYLLDFF